MTFSPDNQGASCHVPARCGKGEKAAAQIELQSTALAAVANEVFEHEFTRFTRVYSSTHEMLAGFRAHLIELNVTSRLRGERDTTTLRRTLTEVLRDFRFNKSAAGASIRRERARVLERLRSETADPTSVAKLMRETVGHGRNEQESTELRIAAAIEWLCKKQPEFPPRGKEIAEAAGRPDDHVNQMAVSRFMKAHFDDQHSFEALWLCEEILRVTRAILTGLDRTPLRRLQ